MKVNSWLEQTQPLVKAQTTFIYLVLQSQATWTWIVLGFLGSGGGNFCTVTLSTPSWHTAEIASVLAFSGNTNFLMNFPILLSTLTYFTPSLSSSLFLSPLITSTLSSSIWTFMSPDFKPGISIRNTYEFGYSFTSAGVAAIAFASRTYACVGALCVLSPEPSSDISIMRCSVWNKGDSKPITLKSITFWISKYEDCSNSFGSAYVSVAERIGKWLL